MQTNLWQSKQEIKEFNLLYLTNYIIIPFTTTTWLHWSFQNLTMHKLHDKNLK